MMNIKKRIAAALLFAAALALPFCAQAEGTTGSSQGTTVIHSLENGSFEEGQTWTNAYSQVDQSAVPSWSTTAFEGKIEMFRENTNAYLTGKLKPAVGNYAAELNADEESTLYQIVGTEPSSLYEWGLYHGARTQKDTMALIIGPKQDYNPSKPSKTGRDQFMQMIDWLKGKNEVGDKLEEEKRIKDSDLIAGKIYNGGTPFLLYSKKFGEKGTFQDNAGNNAFSLTPSSIYTEPWYIWLMTDTQNLDNDGYNRWTAYGSLDKSEASVQSENDTTDGLKYYHYPVPNGQEETIFAFVSVSSYEKGPTYGNFLDGIDFKLYRLMSGSATPHGSGVIVSSGGTAGSTGETSGTGETEHAISKDKGVLTYVKNDEPLTLWAAIEPVKNEQGEIVENRVSFAGVYCTSQVNGKIVTEFIDVSKWELHTTSDTISEKINDIINDGGIVYKYKIENVNSAIDLHYVFLKSPVVTYDANGGKEYDTQQNMDEKSSYDFKSSIENEVFKYVAPYESHAAEALDDKKDTWQFGGWKLFNDYGAVKDTSGSEIILNDVHSVACNFKKIDSNRVAQFVVINHANGFNGYTLITDQNDNAQNGELGVIWNENQENDWVYKNGFEQYVSGLTMVAQWRWKQTFVPMIKDKYDGYQVSNELVSVYVNGQKVTPNEDGEISYYAGLEEKITVKAEAGEGYYFDGWYDEDGNQVSTKAEMTYIEGRNSVKTYKAKFTKKYTHTYKRQYWDGGKWVELEGNQAWTSNGDTIPGLSHATREDTYNARVTCTASDSTSNNYVFDGWYSENQRRFLRVTGDKIIDHNIMGDATFYARYVPKGTVMFVKQLVAGDQIYDVGAEHACGTLSLYSSTDTSGTNAESTASAGANYAFVGWFTKDGSRVNNDTEDNPTTTITCTIQPGVVTTYYARFKSKTPAKLTYKPNGGSGEDRVIEKHDIGGVSTDYHVGDDVTIIEDVFTWDGYKFVCWNEEADGTGETDYRRRDKYVLTKADNILYAQWTPNPTTLTYKANGGVGNSETDVERESTGVVDQVLEVMDNPFTLTGYSFSGWNTTEDGSGTKYGVKDDNAEGGYKYDEKTTYTLTAGEDILYAQWMPNTDTQYTILHIRVDSSGKETTETEDCTGTTGEKVNAENSQKTYPGYTFDKNYTGSVLTGEILADGSLVLKRYYTPNTDTAYTIQHIRLDRHGKGVSMETEDCTGTTDTAADATAHLKAYPGYTFKADHPDNVLSGTIRGDGSLVLKLHYAPNPVTLTYKPNGGEGADHQVSGYVDEQIEVMTNPFLFADHTFVGWNTEPDGSGTAYQPVEPYRLLPDQEHVLYAQWQVSIAQEDVDLPATGDSSHLLLWSLLAGAASALWLALYRGKRARR